MPASRADVRVVYECAGWLYHSSVDDDALTCIVYVAPDRPDLPGALSWSPWELEGMSWSGCSDKSPSAVDGAPDFLRSLSLRLRMASSDMAGFVCCSLASCSSSARAS